jgi:redox-sensitive bicupin YhaK (pirin superfamily)
MIIVRKSEDRRYVDVKDQKTWMTFDPENEAYPCFGALKTLNEEILSPGGGFILHARKDMVVVTYVRDGVIIYKAPLEEPGTIEAKEFQWNIAVHDTKQYAFNTSESEDAHVFQCGFDVNEREDTRGDGPQKIKEVKKLFTHAERQGILRLIASSDGREASLPIQQDVQIYSTFMHNGNHIIHELKPERIAWIHVVKGKILMNLLSLQSGDGAGFTHEKAISFTAQIPTEILLFDLCESVPDPLKESVRSNPRAFEAR